MKAKKQIESKPLKKTGAKKSIKKLSKNKTIKPTKPTKNKAPEKETIKPDIKEPKKRGRPRLTPIIDPGPSQEERIKQDEALFQLFLIAYEENDLNISLACKKIKISRDKYYNNWVKFPDKAARIFDVQKSLMEIANSKYWGIIKNMSIIKPTREAVAILLDAKKNEKITNPVETNKINELLKVLNPNNYK